MDPSLFGSRLRMARERRRLTLQDLATSTKLQASLFASLEEGTCRGWPVGVCSRSHVRTYAELVGLDPAEVVEEFSALFPNLAWSEQDQAPEVVAALRPSALLPRPAIVVAPLRLGLADEPMPFWRTILMRLTWWLHRVANGGGRPVVSGLPAGEGSAANMEEDGTAFVPATGLQVD